MEVINMTPSQTTHTSTITNLPTIHYVQGVPETAEASLPSDVPTIDWKNGVGITITGAASPTPITNPSSSITPTVMSNTNVPVEIFGKTITSEGDKIAVFLIVVAATTAAAMTLAAIIYLIWRLLRNTTKTTKTLYSRARRLFRKGEPTPDEEHAQRTQTPAQAPRTVNLPAPVRRSTAGFRAYKMHDLPRRSAHPSPYAAGNPWIGNSDADFDRWLHGEMAYSRNV